MNKIVALMLIFFTIGVVNIFAKTGKEIAVDLGLNAASRASISWERIFEKDSKMKKYGIDKLNDDEKKALKKYLIEHAADSDKPEAAGM